MVPRKTLISFLVFVSIFSAHGQFDEIDDWNVQQEMALPGEVEGDENKDLQFDYEITSNVKRPERPKKFPDVVKVQRIYETEKDRLMYEASLAGDDLLQNVTVSVKSGFEYYSLFNWKKRALKCCPLEWKYQCKGTDVRMPCFFSFNGNDWEWCCPIWPKVLIRRCDCCQCAILDSFCAHVGQCQRRYSKKSFLAVCYRNKRWAYLRFIVKHLPTSCYCRI